MNDFLGQTIAPGTWVAASGNGNRSAEYGMLLYRVLGVDDGKMLLQRLRVSYPDDFAKVRVSQGTSHKGTKFVVVQPPEEVQALFERVVDQTATQADHALAGKWLHGQTEGLFADGSDFMRV